MPLAEMVGKRASMMANFTIWWQKSPISNLSPVTNTADAVFGHKADAGFSQPC